MRRTLAAVSGRVMCALFATVVALAACAEDHGSFTRTDLFEAGQDGYLTYRIPSLAVTGKGTLLLACSARKDGIGDWADIDTAFRRSTDGGRSWEKMRIVTDDGKNTVDNNTFIVDGGRAFLMYQINYAKAYLKHSDDDGVSWSEPVEITSAFETFRKRDRFDWKVLAMGPGHGIALRTGRLVVPIWLSTSHSHRPSITATVYSDDHGATWKAGDVVTQNLPESKNPSENVLVELADGSVMDNIRCESPGHRRLVAVSKDGASGWSKPTPDEQLFEPVCMASMARYSMEPARKNQILFCNPDSEKLASLGNKAGSYVRANLTVRLSEDEGKTWPVAKVVESGESGYSDLAVGPDGMIYLAYERGGTKGEKVFSPKYLSFARFDLGWMEGK